MKAVGQAVQRTELVHRTVMAKATCPRDGGPHGWCTGYLQQRTTPAMMTGVVHDKGCPSTASVGARGRSLRRSGIALQVVRPRSRGRAVTPCPPPWAP